MAPSTEPITNQGCLKVYFQTKKILSFDTFWEVFILFLKWYVGIHIFVALAKCSKNVFLFRLVTNYLTFSVSLRCVKKSGNPSTNINANAVVISTLKMHCLCDLWWEVNKICFHKYTWVLCPVLKTKLCSGAGKPRPLSCMARFQKKSKMFQ
jgi:hypothetical protein